MTRQVLIANTNGTNETYKAEATNKKSKYPNRVSPETIQAVMEFEQARKDLFEFIADNDEVFNPFMELVLAFNTTHTAAKDAIKKIRTDNKIEVGPFIRSAKPKKVVWDANSIPAEILADRSVIKELDAKYLDTLMEAGRVPDDVVRTCRKIERTTARVTGPKPIVVDP